MKYTLSGSLFNRVRSNCINHIGQLPDDKPVVVEIKPYVKRRNLPQNERFHATIGALAKETGYTPQEVKNLVKDEMNWFEMIDGPLGQRKRYKSSADMNKIQMAESTEILNRWCIDLGVPIAPPKMPGHLR